MNDEIVVRFNGDLTPLGQSLRSMNQMVKNAGQETKNVLKESFGSIGSIISGGAILAGIKGLLNHFDELDDRAQNLSISTDFLQGMQHIASKDAVGGVETFNKAISELSVRLGDAKTGSDEAIKKFEKWGITLKDIADLDTEGMFYKIADKIKGIPDPSERSAAAFELLGKAGKNLVGVMQEGSAAVKGMVDQVDKLDAEKIKMLAEAKDTISDYGGWVTIGAGKLLGGLGKGAQFLGNPQEAWITKMQADWNAKSKAADAGPDKSVLAAQAEKLLDARTKYLDTLARDEGGQTKLNSLVRTRHDLQAKINAMHGDSVEKYALMTKHAENEKDIREQQAKMEKDAMDKRKAGEEARSKRLKDEKQLTDEIRKTRSEISELTNARNNFNAQYGSLQDIANSGYSVFRHNQMEFQQGPNAWEAQQVLDSEARARRERIFGNIEGAKADESYAARLRKDLSDREIISPEEGLKGINDKLQEAEQHQSELLALAKTSGLKVIGPED